MINVSESILKACNSDSVTYVEYIIINGQKVIIKANLSDDSYSNGNFIGTFIMKKLEFETENDIDYKKQEFVYYREINGESFKMGTFIVTDVNDSDTKGLVKVTAYDYTLKFANTYVTELDYASLQITMNDVIDEVCAKVGVQRENQKLANGDFIVDSNQFETSAQYGNVVQAVAQMSGNFAKINENDKLEFIFKKAPQKTIQGSNIHIEDSTNENIPFKLNGNSRQEGTPTPESPVDVETVGSNVNEFSFENAEKIGSYSISSYKVIDNNTIELKGSTDWAYIQYQYVLKANTEYTISYDLEFEGVEDITRWWISIDDEQGSIYANYITLSNNKLIKTFIPKTENVKIKFFASIYDGKQIIPTLTTIRNIKIEKGTKSTPYSPYGQGSVEIDIVNKQLFDKITMTFKKMFLNYDSTAKVNYKLISAGSEDYICYIIPIRNKTITISSNVEGNRYIVCGFENYPVVNMEADQFFSSSSINGTFKANENINYIVLFVCNDGIEPTDVLVEYGETKSNYVEHQSQSKILPIQEEMLEDDYIDEEKEYHTWGEYIFTGAENIWMGDVGKFYSDVIKDYTIVNNIPICNYFKGYINIDGVNNINDGEIAFKNKEDAYPRIYMGALQFSTIEEFKAFLQEKYNSGNPVVVYYKLAEPKSLPLTEEQENIINGGIQLYEDITNITTDNDLATLDITYSSSNVEVIEDYTELDDKRDTRPITIVSLGMTDIEGENVTLRWEEGIQQYGENYLVINDNPFAYTEEKRTQLIQAIFNRVKGFGYSSFETKYAFKPYLQCGDLVKLKNREGQLIDSIILRITANHDDITLSAPSVIDSTVEYEQPFDAIDIAKKTEYKVNKQEQTITQIVQKQDEFDNQLAEVNVSLEGISQKVENIADLTREASGIKTITLENCVAGSLLELHIFGNNTAFDYLYPADDLYPSDDLFPYGDSLIEVTNYPDSSEEGTSVTYDLGITEVLRKNGDVVDEYVLKDGIAQIIRRINKDGTIKETEEIEELGEYVINLLEGTNEIAIKNYTANLSAKYAIKSDYTDIFTTKVETKAEISLATENINIELEKKTDNDKIIASINLSTEKAEDGSQLQLNADKINLNGAVTANGNFKIDTEGNMICNNAQITGGTIKLIDEGESGYFEIKGKTSNSVAQITSNYFGINDEVNQIPEIGVYAYFDRNDNDRVILQVYNTTNKSIIKHDEIITPKVTQTSLESIKKNISIYNDNALQTILNSDIYTYNLKSEKDTDKKHIGFVIGDKYRTPKQVMNNEQNGIELYSTIGILWKGIQEHIKEQHQEIEQLKQEIEKLKKGEK